MATFTTTFRVEEKLNHRHNVDARYRATLSHIDGTRTRENEVLVDEMMGKTKLTSELVGDLFRRHTFKNGKNVLDLIDEYNEGKKPSRQTSVEKEFKKHTGDYHRQIREQEMIFQVGDRFTVNNAFNLGNERISINRDEAKEVLIGAFNDFVERYGDRVIVTQAVLHMDELVPHMHIDYIPCLLQEDKKQGIKVSFSQDAFAKSTLHSSRMAELKREAEESDARNKTKEFNKACYRDFQKNIAELISERARQRGIEIKNPEIGGKHIDKKDRDRETHDLRKEITTNKRELERTEDSLKSTQKNLTQTRQENNQLKQERERNQEKVDLTEQIYKLFKVQSKDELLPKFNEMWHQHKNLKELERQGISPTRLQEQIERICKDIGYETAQRFQGNREQISRAEGRLIHEPAQMKLFSEGVKEWQERQHERNRSR